MIQPGFGVVVGNLHLGRICNKQYARRAASIRGYLTQRRCLCKPSLDIPYSSKLDVASSSKHPRKVQVCRCDWDAVNLRVYKPRLAGMPHAPCRTDGSHIASMISRSLYNLPIGKQISTAPHLTAHLLHARSKVQICYGSCCIRLHRAGTAALVDSR